MTLPRLIFLSGKKRSGKDTFAKQLHDTYGYHRVAFADILKDEVAEKWNLERAAFDADDLKEQKPPGFAYTRRQLLQMHGRDPRQTDPEYWTTLARKKINHLLLKDIKVVVTDARFGNELATDQYKTKNVLKIRIERPALIAMQQQDQHESETALDEWKFDLVLQNLEDEPGAMLTTFEKRKFFF